MSRGTVIFRILLIIGIIYNGSKLYMIQESIKNNRKVKKRVLKKYCHSNRGSKLIINHKGENYTIEVSSKKCRDITIGSVINLYYIKSFNSYYVPFRNDELILVILFSLLFLFSFYKLFFYFFRKKFNI